MNMFCWLPNSVRLPSPPATHAGGNSLTPSLPSGHGKYRTFFVASVASGGSHSGFEWATPATVRCGIKLLKGSKRSLFSLVPLSGCHFAFEKYPPVQKHETYFRVQDSSEREVAGFLSNAPSCCLQLWTWSFQADQACVILAVGVRTETTTWTWASLSKPCNLDLEHFSMPSNLVYLWKHLCSYPCDSVFTRSHRVFRADVRGSGKEA